MTNKLKKYIKFVLSVSLILGLVGSSYAAISASDGSIFITKSELDSMITDLNSRLTTFETGVNSKIDAQITSYLEKNGIWNKKVITFKDGSTSYVIESGIMDKITSFDTNGNYLLKETTSDWAQMSKTGLSSWVVKQSETGYRSLSQKSNNDAPWNTYTWYLVFDVYDKDSTKLRSGASITLRSGTPTYEYSASENNWVQIFIGYSPATYAVYFFVEQDEYVKFSEHWDVVGYYNWSGGNTSDYKKGNVPKYSFSSCGIY